jgi:hypothetical protein
MGARGNAEGGNVPGLTPRLSEVELEQVLDLSRSLSKLLAR